MSIYDMGVIRMRAGVGTEGDDTYLGLWNGDLQDFKFKIGTDGNVSLLNDEEELLVMRFLQNGNVGIGTATPNHLLEMANGAYSDGSDWYPASSRSYKENIKDLNEDEALNALYALNPVTFNYKANREDKHVGFIAEDVPDLVATRNRKGLSPMDIVAVLTSVVKEQQMTLSEMSKEIKELKKELELQQKLLLQYNLRNND